MVAVDATGQIYASQFEFGEDYRLYRIDPATGASTLIGNLGQAIVAGAFVDGILYGLSYDNDLYTIDLTSGVATFHSATTLSDDTFFTAMAYWVVPEPSTGVLTVLGLMALTARRRGRG